MRPPAMPAVAILWSAGVYGNSPPVSPAGGEWWRADLNRRPPAENTGKTTDSGQRAAPGAAPAAKESAWNAGRWPSPLSPPDSELRQVIDAWAELPTAVQAGIVAMVNASVGERGDKAMSFDLMAFAKQRRYRVRNLHDGHAVPPARPPKHGKRGPVQGYLGADDRMDAILGKRGYVAMDGERLSVFASYRSRRAKDRRDGEADRGGCRDRPGGGHRSRAAGRSWSKSRPSWWPLAYPSSRCATGRLTLTDCAVIRGGLRLQNRRKRPGRWSR